ncbi:hypothetical protein ACFFV7_51170 [Nonomuraea spiralis]|uniref:Uncharacterized protein n=1 Tax=Nonomuraea spiralis TaxID=46182 RepID=A0ABV5J0V9_9ACTN|nr:hypothetical protein [Nonomuraea spiralis]
MLLPTTTALLWILNVAYVAAERTAWPTLGEWESGQRLLIGTMIVFTIAWLLEKQGIEYRIGYRQGQQDRDQ